MWIEPFVFESSCTQTDRQLDRHHDTHTYTHRDKHEYYIVGVDKPQL